MPLVIQGMSIASGQSMSTSTLIGGANQQVVGLILPAGWDPAPITFQWSNDNASWYDIFDRQGHEQTFTFTPNAFIPIQSQYGFYTFPYLQIRSGSRALPIKQSAARQFKVVSQ